MIIARSVLLLVAMMPVAAWGQADPPGTVHRISPVLPPPHATRSASRSPGIVPVPPGGRPLVPPGFSASEFASGLDLPRTLRTAPNGDVFLAESGAGRIRVFRSAGPERPEPSVFAADLTLPFGIAFWPPGPAPRYVYVAENQRVVRFPYVPGDTKARGPAEVVVPHLPEGGHWTRDVVFSADGRTMFVSVGSASNVATGLTGAPPAGAALGAAWGDETDRADVLAFDPDGRGRRIYATGLRNCVAMALQPPAGTLWCVVNERDGLGDDLPPDYATTVREGAFYGWPWFYIGDHPEPRLHGARQDLAGRVTVPDVLIQAHSAPLGVVFYEGAQFPPEYRGDAFVALHGSWNRSHPTGYKVIRLRFRDARPTGGYEDFATGFLSSDGSAWARPVGVTVSGDGALLVSEDANGRVWRIARSR